MFLALPKVCLIFAAEKSKPGDSGKDFATSAGDNENDASFLKLTKQEKRQKLKKSRKEAKKLAKIEDKGNIGEQNLHKKSWSFFSHFLD